MKKKEFRSSLDILLQNSNALPQDQEAPSKETVTPSNREVKAAFVISEDHLMKIKAIAFYERKKIKEIVAEMVELYSNQYNQDSFKEILALYNKHI